MEKDVLSRPSRARGLNYLRGVDESENRPVGHKLLCPYDYVGLTGAQFEHVERHHPSSFRAVANWLETERAQKEP